MTPIGGTVNCHLTTRLNGWLTRRGTDTFASREKSGVRVTLCARLHLRVWCDKGLSLKQLLQVVTFRLC